MSLSEAIRILQLAVQEVIAAAFSDDKTPLGNALALAQAASRVGSGGDNPDVIIFGDLNRFKNFNDLFGHLAGDAAIQRAGEMIKELAVDECSGQAFRRSGDEFVILLSASYLEHFKSKASNFASCSFEIEEQIRKTAMSFGCAVSSGNVDFPTLLNRAEVACQLAKYYGDGECVEWSEEIEQQARHSIRDRCSNCDTKIACSVPLSSRPSNNELLCCPCCGKSLVDKSNNS